LRSDHYVKLGNNSFRDFLYAGDQAIMATELLEKGEFGDVYNLGSETGVKIWDLPKMIAPLMGWENDSIYVTRDESRVRPYEIWHLLSDNTKIYSVIKSRPQVNLEEALKRTIAWFKDQGNKWPWE
jgi:dTDP-glucose 4,6-dehydratase